LQLVCKAPLYYGALFFIPPLCKKECEYHYKLIPLGKLKRVLLIVRCIPSEHMGQKELI